MAQQTLTQSTSPRMPFRTSPVVSRAGLYLVTIALCVMFGYPLFWTLMSSLKTIPEMFSFPPILIPSVPQWGNYWQVLNISYPVGRWFLNSTWIVIMTTGGSIVTASLVAYSFARFDYRAETPYS